MSCDAFVDCVTSLLIVCIEYSESETASRDSSWRMSNDKMPADNSGSFNDQTRRRGGRGGSDGKNGDFFQGEPSKGDFTADFQGNDNTLFLGQFR